MTEMITKFYIFRKCNGLSNRLNIGEDTHEYVLWSTTFCAEYIISHSMCLDIYIRLMVQSHQTNRRATDKKNAKVVLSVGVRY